MTLLSALTLLNYGLVLIFGLFLSTFIAGGWDNKQQKRLIFILCPLFLAAQVLSLLLWDLEFTQKLYPLIVHMPLVLILIFALKKRPTVSLISVCTAYLCCQIPRWINLSVAAVSGSALAGEISYTLRALFPSFFCCTASSPAQRTTS